MSTKGRKIIVITGPTATGKSSLAVDLARHLKGEIISADSMQVYRYMDIGTAKPSMEERKGIPHYLFDVADPDEEFNASLFRSLALKALDSIPENKICFVVGGTGLYIKILLGGILECPASDRDIRYELMEQWEKNGPSFVYGKLKEVDKEAAQKIHPNDRTRVIRALEIFQLTGETASSLAVGHGFSDESFDALKIGLHVDRKILYKRINKRCVSMISDGLVEEARSLMDRGFSSDLKSMKSLGYRHAVEYIKNRWNQDEMLTKFQTDTRRYAKRQLTWFRNDPEIIWIEPNDRNSMIRMIEEFI